jgi:hypothetical protein
MLVELSHHSRHIILIPSQPVFALTPYCCVLSHEAANTNFIGEYNNHDTPDEGEMFDIENHMYISF